MTKTTDDRRLPMQAEDKTSYIPRQIEATIRLSDQRMAATCATSAIGRDGLLIKGGPILPAGAEVELTLFSDHRETLSFRCVVEGHQGGEQRLRYHEINFDQRVRLEDITRPHWDGADLLDGLMTMACLYGATSLKDWLCMTSLLQQIQPRLLNRHGSLA